VFRFAVKSHPAILAAAGCCAALLVSIAFAQAPPPKQKPPAAVQPYEKVAITLPTALNDASFDAFRKQLADVATRSDKAGLANLVINEGFFWKRDARERLDKADKKKSGIDNLTVALQLNAKDGSGWYQLVLYAFDTTAAPVEGINGVICSPPDPTYNQQDFEALLQTTKTHAEEWGYVLINNIEVRSGRRPNDPVVETLGLHFVRVLEEASETNAAQPLPLLLVVTPSGKTGYIPDFALAQLGNDQLCYRKDANGWKIVGFLGGEQ